MAIIIRNSDQRHKPMTRGERRFADRLESFLEDDYLCWFDIPLGEKRRYTDFVILHPGRGLLFLEVKDWSIDNIKSITPDAVYLLTNTGLKRKTNPLLQARQCATHYVQRIERDKVMLQTEGKYKGKLCCPWGYGAVLPNISRAQLNDALVEDVHDVVMSRHLVICKDEMLPSTESEQFQEQLWTMFQYQFGEKLTLPQIERIRWHLFPEIRIGHNSGDLFGKTELRQLPDIVKVMDIQQEQLARSLGDGHRVVHGVAGSGKTLILGYRSLYLSQTAAKPILVLCFNKALAQKLESFLKEKGVNSNVHIYHFHEWCKIQLKTYHVEVADGEKPIWERQVLAVIDAVERKQIPREQYGALLIDEGHDFEAEWLHLIVQMIDKENNSLLLLYDDAQSIYNRKRALDFSLSSVGIQARGRTTILKINYRNTREILQFAYDFAKEFLEQKFADDDHVPLIQPEMAGNSGVKPVFNLYRSLTDEMAFVSTCLITWSKAGIDWKDMAVIFPSNWLGEKLFQQLKDRIPCDVQKNYKPDENQVSLLTRHSSKGLEFSHVIVMGVGHLKDDEESLSAESRLLYVAMTRAKEELIVTAHSKNIYAEKLLRLAS